MSDTRARLDFDYLTGLARSNPSEFERLRRQAIDAYIDTLPPERQQRMRCLQWRIDQERRRHTPLGACVQLSKMMWDHLLGPGGLIGQLQGEPASASTEAVTSRVIPFPKA